MKLVYKMKELIIIYSYKQKTVLPYCLKCKKVTESITPRVWKTSHGKTILLSKCDIWGSKKSRFIEKRETSGLLNSLDIKALLSKIPLLGAILLWWFDSCYGNPISLG